MEAFKEEQRVRERLSLGILVGVLIFLLAFVFAILGKGEYEPPTSGESGSANTGSQVALVAPASL